MLREPIDITIALTDFFRNAGEGERYAKFASDMGKAKSAEDIEGIRSRLKEYEFTNPAYVAKAQDDLNSQLTSYVAAKKFGAEQAEKGVASSALNEAALLYPSWREERGATVPVSEFYNDYQGRIPGEALGLESYKRGFDALSGGISEGEKRSVDAGANADKIRSKGLLNDYIVNYGEVPNSVSGHNLYFEGMRKIKGVLPEDIADYQKEFVGRNAGAYSGKNLTTTSKVGSETGASTVGLDVYGRPMDGTKATANDNPANRALAYEQLKQKKGELAKPNFYTVEYPDGTITQYNAAIPAHSIKLNEVAETGTGVISRSDNSDAQSDTVYDEQGNTTRTTKKVRKKIKGNAPTVSVVRDAKGNLVIKRN